MTKRVFLSTLGVPNIMITKYRWTANTPRAHITNQRAMEIFRDLGIEDQVLADATAHHLVAPERPTAGLNPPPSPALTAPVAVQDGDLAHDSYHD